MLALYLTYIEDEEDKKLFESIYLSYRKQMWQLAVSIVGSEADAEDIVHDVFLRIVSKHAHVLLDIKNAVDMRNYLLKATKNTALNWKKKRSRLVSMDMEENTTEYDMILNIADEDFVEMICRKYEYQRLLHVLNELDQKYKDVIYYHFVMELSVPQTAKLLGRSIETTKKQLMRGKKKLLFLLGRMEKTDE